MYFQIVILSILSLAIINFGQDCCHLSKMKEPPLLKELFEYHNQEYQMSKLTKLVLTDAYQSFEQNVSSFPETFEKLGNLSGQFIKVFYPMDQSLYYDALKSGKNIQEFNKDMSFLYLANMCLKNSLNISFHHEHRCGDTLITFKQSPVNDSEFNLSNFILSKNEENIQNEMILNKLNSSFKCLENHTYELNKNLINAKSLHRSSSINNDYSVDDMHFELPKETCPFITISHRNKYLEFLKKIHQNKLDFSIEFVRNLTELFISYQTGADFNGKMNFTIVRIDGLHPEFKALHEKSIVLSKDANEFQIKSKNITATDLIQEIKELMDRVESILNQYKGLFKENGIEIYEDIIESLLEQQTEERSVTRIFKSFDSLDQQSIETACIKKRRSNIQWITPLFIAAVLSMIFVCILRLISNN